MYFHAYMGRLLVQNIHFCMLIKGERMHYLKECKTKKQDTLQFIRDSISFKNSACDDSCVINSVSIMEFWRPSWQRHEASSCGSCMRTSSSGVNIVCMPNWSVTETRCNFVSNISIHVHYIASHSRCTIYSEPYSLIRICVLLFS